MKNIKDFQVGDNITGFYLLKKLEMKQTASFKDYFDMIISDKTGEITAKLWDVAEGHKLTLLSPLVSFPMVIKIQGTVHTFKEKLDFKVVNLRPATKEEQENGNSIENFIKFAPIKSEILMDTIKEKIESVNNTIIKCILHHCFKRSEQKLNYYPAAKGIHHAFYSGLAYHIVRMIELAEFICKQRPFLNRDLLIASIILHDLGKTEELISTIGSSTEYSTVGKLIGHISIIQGWIIESALEFGIDPNTEIIILLQHMVLSHHNLKEWGSPVQPQLPEAIALHYIDNVDAKLQAVEDALLTSQEDEKWTQPVRAIENYSIYKGGRI
jgi:3'-5' exoribonuclease